MPLASPRKPATVPEKLAPPNGSQLFSVAVAEAVQLEVLTRLADTAMELIWAIPLSVPEKLRPALAPVPRPTVTLDNRAPGRPGRLMGAMVPCTWELMVSPLAPGVPETAPDKVMSGEPARDRSFTVAVPLKEPSELMLALSEQVACACWPATGNEAWAAKPTAVPGPTVTLALSRTAPWGRLKKGNDWGAVSSAT